MGRMERSRGYSRASGSFPIGRRYIVWLHRTQASSTAGVRPSHLPKSTRLLLCHLVQVSIPIEKPYLVLFCIEPSSSDFFPASPPQASNGIFKNVYCETEWTQCQSAGAPALQWIYIWSQFLLQSVTMETKFISELQGVKEFISCSLFGKKKNRLGNPLGNWKMNWKKRNLRKNRWEDLQ